MSSSRLLDAFEKTTTGFHSRVEGVAWCSASTATDTDFGACSRGARGHESEADGLAVGVRTVELADCLAGVGEGFVGYEGSAGGAAGAVEAEGKGDYGTDAGEEVLCGVLVGWFEKHGEGERTSRSSSVRS